VEEGVNGGFQNPTKDTIVIGTNDARILGDMSTEKAHASCARKCSGELANVRIERTAYHSRQIIHTGQDHPISPLLPLN
jgi:hypothetical protein